MAAEEPPQAQGRPADDSVLIDGFAGVGRATWMKTTMRAQERGEGGLIGPDEEERQCFHDEARFFLIDSSA